jgi:hypothetical protein
MTIDYWDVDHILASEESIEVNFLVSGPGLGHLDCLQSQNGKTLLPLGSVLSLPVWLGLSMAKMGFVEPVLPERYRSGMQNVLRKGPEGARLGEKSKNYFRIGLALSWLIPNCQELAAAIFLGVMQRVRFIIDRCAHAGRDEDKEGEFVHLFTDSECEIYLAGARANEEFDHWRHGYSKEIRPWPELVPLFRPSGISN